KNNEELILCLFISFQKQTTNYRGIVQQSLVRYDLIRKDQAVNKQIIKLPIFKNIHDVTS
ncbi:unnamed protein product, partial [Brassica napus]